MPCLHCSDPDRNRAAVRSTVEISLAPSTGRLFGPGIALVLCDGILGESAADNGGDKKTRSVSSVDRSHGFQSVVMCPPLSVNFGSRYSHSFIDELMSSVDSTVSGGHPLNLRGRKSCIRGNSFSQSGCHKNFTFYNFQLSIK